MEVRERKLLKKRIHPRTNKSKGEGEKSYIILTTPILIGLATQSVSSFEFSQEWLSLVMDTWEVLYHPCGSMKHMAL